MSRSFRAALLSGVALVAIAGSAHAQSAPSADPSGRIGRLSYVQGTVSYHDAQQDTWSTAAINTPLTSGSSLWTEPTGHDEIAISGTRVRMDGDTQLDLQAIDDSQTRLQLDQGRLDINAFSLDSNQPYQVVTPRGTVTLEQQGDYYIHAGSTDDPTLIGVRAGAAQLRTPNGETLTLHAGQVGEVSGDSNALQVNTIQSAPPPVPTYWAQRDQQITYAQPQYVTADMTGYEDLQVYGSWSSDPQYGEVWAPNSPPAGWAPYRTGEWVYQAPYGWTWVDAQPWGFAPYHYGRWAQRDDRWFWVPPQRAERPVYAPALVAFVGGLELGVALGEQSRAPVGWFPLGPREPYVPPYAIGRGYYNRVNSGYGVQQAMLDDRWQRAERHEAFQEDQQHPLANRRFATVVSAEDFARSRPVQQAALKVSADKLASAPVAPVSAPPAPNRSIAAQQGGPGARPNDPAHLQAQHANAPGNLPTAQTRFANMESIGRPAPAAQAHGAPGPKIEAHATVPANGKPALPPLSPRVGAAPTRIEGERTPAAGQHPSQVPPVPQANRTEPNRAEPPKPNQPPQVQGQHPEPAHPEARPGQPAVPQAQHPTEPQRAEPQRPQPQHPAENRAPAPQPQHPAEPQRPAETHAPAPQPPHRAEAPRAEPQHQAPQARAPEPPRPAAAPPQAHVEAPHPAAPPPQAHAPEPPHQQAQAPHPEPPHPAPAPQPEHKEEKK